MSTHFPLPTAHCPLPTAHCPLPTPRPRRPGISLLEVLISMFVLLFGLMGVAAIFPVGNHFAGKGEQYDRGAALADQAFADLKARGMLRTSLWLYPHLPNPSSESNESNSYNVIQANVDPGRFNISSNTGRGPGHAFVIDPLGLAADVFSSAPSTAGLDLFPYAAVSPHPWGPYVNNAAAPPYGITGEAWPIRRVTLPAVDATPSMTPAVAETIFRLRDDLTNATPEADDRPGIQRFSMQIVGAPDKPDDLIPDDDIPLTRAYAGAYSWIATVSPLSGSGNTTQQGLQPAAPQYGSQPYEVSVAVFNKRDATPSAESERMLQAEIAGSELILYGATADEVDTAMDGIFSAQWIAVAGVDQRFNTGHFILKWYKLLSLDDETVEVDVNVMGTVTTMQGRRATVDGAEWPIVTGAFSAPNLRAILLPGIIGVSTQSLPMERD